MFPWRSASAGSVTYGLRSRTFGDEAMSLDRYRHVARSPRHEALLVPSGKVQAELISRQPALVRPARLVNISRQGMQILLSEPAVTGELITVRITAAGLRESHPHDIQMTIEAPNYSGR